MTADKKFIKSKKLEDYEVLTDDGWIDIDAIHETIPYDVFNVKTQDKKLRCADNHVLYRKDGQEIFAVDLEKGDYIKTKDGNEKVTSIEASGIKENMYDLELDFESNKRYYTNGILSHNTSYIRHLAGEIYGRNIIFVPPEMVHIITDPGFVPFLLNNDDSVLIIEDAEPALRQRAEGERSSGVSNILNLTDGLLSDCVNISIVATFNTDLDSLDPALTRKGRLLKHYTFEKLDIKKSQKLLKKLGHKDAKVEHPMSLADIYFYGDDTNEENAKTSSKKRVGFSK